MPALPLAKLQARMQELVNWGLEGNALVKEFQFHTFPEAMIFVNNVAELATQHDHHPTISIDYTLVRLRLITHDEQGLTDKDFLLAKAIDGVQKL